MLLRGSLALTLACTPAGSREAEPEHVAAPPPVIEQPQNEPARRRAHPSALLPPIYLRVEVLAHTTDGASTHALVDGWIVVQDRHRTILVAPDGSIHTDPALAFDDLDPDQRVDMIVGRWPDDLYALVTPSEIDDAWRERPMPLLYRWHEGWTEVTGDGRSSEPAAYPPAWFYDRKRETGPSGRPYAPRT